MFSTSVINFPLYRVIIVCAWFSFEKIYFYSSQNREVIHSLRFYYLELKYYDLFMFDMV